MSARPMTVDAVHAMLEARANPKMLTIPGDTPEQKNWPYLLGMCEFMLAEAYTELTRFEQREARELAYYPFKTTKRAR